MEGNRQERTLGSKGGRHTVRSVRGQAHWEETFGAKLGAGEGSRRGGCLGMEHSSRGNRPSRCELDMSMSRWGGCRRAWWEGVGRGRAAGPRDSQECLYSQ